MGTPHIGANRGDVAETILLPGDPLRAKYIAETFLEDVVQYNNVRGMLGFTGTYKGKKVSVQGTGMGVPSIGIYSHELITEFGVKNLIRVGTAGSYQEDVKVRDVVIAMSASTDSAINKLRFNGADYAPTASPELLFKAYEVACKRYNTIPTKYVAAISYYTLKTKDLVRRTDFLNPIEVDFEFTKIPIIQHYDEYLKSLYGNYMVFIKGTELHTLFIIDTNKPYVHYLK